LLWHSYCYIIGKEENTKWEEEMVMKLTFLMIIILLALIMPLLWITGTLTSIIYFCRHRAGTTRKERTVALNPQLGLTMADGGDPMDEEKKESAAIKQVTETSQGSPEQITLRHVNDKMFWWGGYN
jgi:hypothetical protein